MRFLHHTGFPLHPYHLNHDTTHSLGALVADSKLYKFMQLLTKTKSEWKDWYMIGPKLAQPIVQPVGWTNGQLAFVKRLFPSTRDMSFASAHGRYGTNNDTVIVVTNWMPWPLQFKVSFDAAKLKVSPTVSSTVEYIPTIGASSACTSSGVPSGGSSPITVTSSASFPGLREFTTATIPPATVAVYRLQ